MNSILKLLSVSAICASLASCEMTLVPEDTLSPDTYFSNAEQLELWSNGFYAQLETAENLTGQDADDLIENNLGEVLMGQRSAASESGWSWTQLRNIKYLLANVYRCSDVSARNQYTGVALFHRAYFYFIKVRRYGDVPFYDTVINSDDNDLLYKERDDRGTVMDLIMADLDNAIELLPVAKDQAHVTKWTALALKSRVALYEGTWRKYRGMENADKYLRLAAEAAEDFIDNGGYKLYSTGATPYRDMFNSIECVGDEVILARKYGSSANVMHSVVFNFMNGRAGMTKRFMNHYLMADGSYYSAQQGYKTKEFVDEVSGRDPRLAQTILTPGYVQVGATAETVNSLTSLTGYEPIKYYGASAYTGSNKGISDYPLMRAAEVFLNFAEAKAELGTLSQSDLDKSVNKLRDRAGMPHLSMVAANADIDPLMAEYYPNVTQSANTGVILEIRRERTVELCLEGFRLWDIFRWKEGQQLTKPFYGVYFNGPGEYDMNNDGTPDLKLYTDNAGSFSGTSKKIGTDIKLTEGTFGNIHAQSTVTVAWDETRDYLWPIPANERVLSGGVLSQNPGYTDSTNFN